MTSEIMHVRVDNHKDLRRDLLKCALDSTRLLRDYEKFRKIRNEKEKRVKELHNIFKEIKVLKSQLKRYGLPELPKEVKVEIKARERKFEVPTKVITPKQALKVTKKSPKKKAIKKKTIVKDKLSSEIDEIENMLKNL